MGAMVGVEVERCRDSEAIRSGAAAAAEAAALDGSWEAAAAYESGGRRDSRFMRGGQARGIEQRGERGGIAL